ncbi:IS1380 family transposase [Polaribacter sp. IC066]|uniref:IS1380 family transposase n=1 Tax=Polaribacter sp. IC066 TaxID=57032 RepID=UPI0011BEDE06|nr:IS1380 family transposase [Polaribacter sp. IC066]TXD55040.1 IS1380 family transposase [Polaribacter sp. IC066]
MKITTTTENISAYGGLNFISEIFNNLEFSSLIEKHLGQRPLQSEFSYSDVIKNLWMLFLAGGDCAEDIEQHLKSDFLQIPNLKVCSPDTIGRVLKSLAQQKEVHISDTGIEHEFSTHENLNVLNLEMLLKTKVLAPKQSYDFDFDHQFIPCEKYDSKKSYKMKRGYFPGVSTIGKYIVHIENRNGNTNVKYKQADTLKSSYSLLKSKNIKINRSRMDCGSFSKDIIDVVEKNSNLLYIRAQRCAELSCQIRAVKNWKTVRIGLFDIEVCSVKYTPFKGDKTYRYVVSRERNKTGQTDIEYQDNFIYRAILTTDTDSSDQEVIEYYNQRGAAEKIFDEMNNDFGWKKLPFSFLEQNTVFMMVMAMCRNFFLHLLTVFSEKVSFVKTTYRLKKFIFRFVVVPFKWIYHSRQNILKLYTKKEYPLLI